MTELELVPPHEAERIRRIVEFTIQQLKQRYPNDVAVLRGVHPKSHGCVRATFEVAADLDPALRAGVFATPGKRYEAWVRFSNAAVLLGPDTKGVGGVVKHDSRGMAIKLLDVEGKPLDADAFGPRTQDFLMVNHPVFAFSNTEDYEELSRVITEDNDNPARFFARIKKGADSKPLLDDPATARAVQTLTIIGRLQSNGTPTEPPPFQRPPASPVETRYFSGAPFLFGRGRVMKYSARPTAPQSDRAPKVDAADYMREALIERLADAKAGPVEFEFLVQVRTAEELAGKLDPEIEDASHEWPETAFPFAKVATLTIPLQSFDSPEHRAACERLFFTPWHGVEDHRPLGGINRLRRAVYEASARFRMFPKEPAAG